MHTEAHYLADRLQRIGFSDPWYGDCVFKILDGVTAEQAARRVGNAHTIWEIVKHITASAIVDTKRLQGEFAREPEDGNWWPKPGSGEEQWQADLNGLRVAIQDLSKAIHELAESEYEKSLMNTAHTFREQMHEAIEHVVYHAGQMAVLKKAV